MFLVFSFLISHISKKVDLHTKFILAVLAHVLIRLIQSDFSASFDWTALVVDTITGTRSSITDWYLGGRRDNSFIVTIYGICFTIVLFTLISVRYKIKEIIIISNSFSIGLDGKPRYGKVWLLGLIDTWISQTNTRVKYKSDGSNRSLLSITKKGEGSNTQKLPSR